MKRIQITACLFPLAFSAVAVFWLALKENNMNTSDWLAIAVALIGVIGALIANLFQLKRDGKTITNVDRTTSETKPQIKNIAENTQKVRDVITEEIRPEVKQISSANSKLDYITSEIEYQKRIKSDVSSAVSDSAYLIAGINKVYEENARLSSLCASQKESIRVLTFENADLIQENSRLKNELETYRQAHRKTR